MANDPGDWFDRNTADPEEVAIMDSLVKRITVGQLDPADVVKRYVELVEADETELVNFIPKDILERLSKPQPPDRAPRAIGQEPALSRSYAQ